MWNAAQEGRIQLSGLGYSCFVLRLGGSIDLIPVLEGGSKSPIKWDFSVSYSTTLFQFLQE